VLFWGALALFLSPPEFLPFPFLEDLLLFLVGGQVLFFMGLSFSKPFFCCSICLLRGALPDLLTACSFLPGFLLAFFRLLRVAVVFRLALALLERLRIFSLFSFAWVKCIVTYGQLLFPVSWFAR
jgi:hypothetical protein